MIEEAGEGEHQSGGGLIVVETVRGDQKGRMAGNAPPFMSHDRCPSDTRKIFFLSMTMTFVRRRGRMREAGVPGGAEGRRGSHGTVDMEISDEKARLFW